MIDRLVIGVAGDAADAALASDSEAFTVRDAAEVCEAIRESGAASVRVFCPAALVTIEFLRAATAAALAADATLGIQPIGGGCEPPAEDPMPRAPARSIVLYSDAIDGRQLSGRVSYLGRGADLPTEVRDGAATILLHTHSNGADHRIGTDVLCVQADALRPSPAVAGERSFPCHAGGACLREDLPVRSYFGAAAIRAHGVVMMSCTGLVPSGGVIDFRFGLIPALLRAGVRSIVASFQIHSINIDVALAAARYLNQGASLGRLAAMLNEVTQVPSYVCIGDPDLVLDSALSESELPAPRLCHRPPRKTMAAAIPRRRFLAQVVRRLAEGQSSPPAVARAEELARALELAGEDDRAIDGRLASYLAHDAARGTLIHKHWQVDLPPAPEMDSGERHSCGERLLAQHTASSDYAGVARTLWICERCGNVGDMPAGTAPPWPVLAHGRASLDVDRFTSGGLWLVSTLEPVGRCVEPVRAPRWIEGDERTAEIPTSAVHVVPGLRWLTVVITWAAQFAVIRQPLEVP